MILINFTNENNEISIVKIIFFITGSSDNNLKLWSLNEFKCMKTLMNRHNWNLEKLRKVYCMIMICFVKVNYYYYY